MLKFRAPILVQWELTSQCNKKCIHCYNYWRTFDDNKYGIQKKIVDRDSIVDRIIESQVFSVIITGGEPLLMQNEMTNYIKRLRENNISVSINSNLSLLTNDTVIALKEMEVESILTSLPTYLQERDAIITNSQIGFKGTIDGILLAQEYGIKVIPNMVISKVNINDIYETVSMVRNLGINRMSFNFMIPPKNNQYAKSIALSTIEINKAIDALFWASEQFQVKISSVENYPFCICDDMNKLRLLGMIKGCGEGKNYCVIDEEGSIRSCIVTDEIVSMELMDAWKVICGQKYSQLPIECKDCKYVKMCAGGCRFAKNWRNFYNKNHWVNEMVFGEKLMEVNENCYFRFWSNLKYREEAKGGIIFRSNQNYIYIDRKTYNFFLKHKFAVFSTDQFWKECGFAKRDALIILKLLMQKKVLESIQL